MNASSPDFESESKVNVADSVAVPFGSTELARGTWMTLVHSTPGTMGRDGSVAGIADCSVDVMARPRPVGT
jgi:hypothetical protein